MKNALVITCLFFIWLGALDKSSFAQKKSCTCKDVGGRTCSGTVICTNGCSAICGKKDTCYLSCSTQLLGKSLNIEFVQKTTEEMVATLASESHLRLKFQPNPRTANQRYDYKLIDSDIWKILEFLDERGTLTVNGIDFGELRELKKNLKAGGRLAKVTFNNIPVDEAVEKLELVTGEDLKIVSGNPSELISVSIKSVTLADILKAIRKKTGVRVAIVT